MPQHFGDSPVEASSTFRALSWPGKWGFDHSEPYTLPSLNPNIGVIKGDTRSLDYSSHVDAFDNKIDAAWPARQGALLCGELVQPEPVVQSD